MKTLRQYLKIFFVAVCVNMLLIGPVFAEIKGLGDEKTAEDLNKFAWMVGTDYLLPVAFGVIFVVTLIVSIMMAGSATNPNKHSDSSTALGRVAMAAVVAIASTIFIGVLIGIANKVMS